MRLHGREPKLRDSGEACKDRGDYLYTEQELEALAIRVAAMAGQAALLRVYAVTDRGSAPRNAASLARLAKAAGLATES